MPSQERNNAASLEKKQKQIDKQITEWKSRYESKEAELDNASREARQFNTEVRNNELWLICRLDHSGSIAHKTPCVEVTHIQLFSSSSYLLVCVNISYQTLQNVIYTVLPEYLNYHYTLTSSWSCVPCMRKWRSTWRLHAGTTSACRV